MRILGTAMDGDLTGMGAGRESGGKITLPSLEKSSTLGQLAAKCTVFVNKMIVINCIFKFVRPF